MSNIPLCSRRRATLEHETLAKEHQELISHQSDEHLDARGNPQAPSEASQRQRAASEYGVCIRPLASGWQGGKSYDVEVLRAARELTDRVKG